MLQWSWVVCPGGECFSAGSHHCQRRPRYRGSWGVLGHQPFGCLRSLRGGARKVARLGFVSTGDRSLNVKLPGVRRVHMARIHYHVYYRVADTPPAVEVLALWHTSRGSVLAGARSRCATTKEEGTG